MSEVSITIEDCPCCVLRQGENQVLIWYEDADKVISALQSMKDLGYTRSLSREFQQIKIQNEIYLIKLEETLFRLRELGYSDFDANVQWLTLQILKTKSALDSMSTK